jgi:hypothetical protein
VGTEAKFDSKPRRGGIDYAAPPGLQYLFDALTHDFRHRLLIDRPSGAVCEKIVETVLRESSNYGRQ